MPKRILITGATGFQGSVVASSMATIDTSEIRLLVRPGTTHVPGSSFSLVEGDLTQPSSLRAATRGVDVVVHCAGYIGYDPTLCREVNIGGTAAIARAAADAGVGELLYLSTTAVHGSGPHRGQPVDRPVPPPASTLSASRREAERLVLAYGGEVVRTSLVYGVGDRWVVPTLSKMTSAIGGLVEGGGQLMSIIHVEELGRAVASIVSRGGLPGRSRVAHLANPTAVSVRAIICRLLMKIDVDIPTTTVSLSAARESAGASERSRSQLDMICSDRWHESEELWSGLGLTPIDDLPLSDADFRWYRSDKHEWSSFAPAWAVDGRHGAGGRA